RRCLGEQIPGHEPPRRLCPRTEMECFMLKRLMFTATFALSLPVLAQNAGDPCGALTVEGECQANEAVFCNTQADEVVRVNCDDLAGDGSIAAATCTIFPGWG